jgi:hypothetical protein
MPQGKVKFTITTAPRRPVRKPPQLMLAAPAPTIPALEREIAEVEERLLALRAKLAGLTAQRGNGRSGPKRRRASRGESASREAQNV